MRYKPRTLVMMALFIAISILLRRILTIHLPVGIVNFAGFPIILAGFLFGPLEGGLVGAISDILGYPLFPEGPYLPFFTLTSALTGIIPALTVKFSGIRGQIPLWLLILAIFTGQCITKVLLVPYIFSVYFGVPFVLKAAANFAVEIIHTPLYAMLAQPVLMLYGAMSGPERTAAKEFPATGSIGCAKLP
ncbi:MAG: folate family ECF transporter S component [Candidatus Eremiobacteraeota bacterium]|nr:folate family ECF transporter S component [Candidatus Eremiobacteraeota bacterium]